jgi:prevent-host-death family protein
MKVSVTDAEGQLADLIQRTEAGEEVILTRHGHAVVRPVPIKALPDRTSRRALLEAVRVAGRAKAADGPSAGDSQDFLYGHDGLPA